MSQNILSPDVGDVDWDSVTSVDDWDTFCLGTKTDWGLSLSCHEGKKVCLHFSLCKGKRQQLLPQFFFCGWRRNTLQKTPHLNECCQVFANGSWMQFFTNWKILVINDMKTEYGNSEYGSLTEWFFALIGWELCLIRVHNYESSSQHQSHL